MDPNQPQNFTRNPEFNSRVFYIGGNPNDKAHSSFSGYISFVSINENDAYIDDSHENLFQNPGKDVTCINIIPIITSPTKSTTQKGGLSITEKSTQSTCRFNFNQCQTKSLSFSNGYIGFPSPTFQQTLHLKFNFKSTGSSEGTELLFASQNYDLKITKMGITIKVIYNNVKYDGPKLTKDSFNSIELEVKNTDKMQVHSDIFIQKSNIL